MRSTASGVGHDAGLGASRPLYSQRPSRRRRRSRRGVGCAPRPRCVEAADAAASSAANGIALLGASDARPCVTRAAPARGRVPCVSNTVSRETRGLASIILPGAVAKASCQWDCASCGRAHLSEAQLTTAIDAPPSRRERRTRQRRAPRAAVTGCGARPGPGQHPVGRDVGRVLPPAQVASWCSVVRAEQVLRLAGAGHLLHQLHQGRPGWRCAQSSKPNRPARRIHSA
eukprot:scaffold1237_cov403-Prasinococcus_capsulatus_cf.AAC.8